MDAVRTGPHEADRDCAGACDAGRAVHGDGVDLARPAWVSQGQAVAGIVLLGVVWLSTWGIQVPCHARLSRGFDARTHRRLVRSNWIRTICWTVRGGIVLGMAMGAWR